MSQAISSFQVILLKYSSLSCVLHTLPITSFLIWSPQQYLVDITNYEAAYYCILLHLLIASCLFVPDVLLSNLIPNHVLPRRCCQKHSWETMLWVVALPRLKCKRLNRAATVGELLLLLLSSSSSSLSAGVLFVSLIFFFSFTTSCFQCIPLSRLLIAYFVHFDTRWQLTEHSSSPKM